MCKRVGSDVTSDHYELTFSTLIAVWHLYLMWQDKCGNYYYPQIDSAKDEGAWNMIITKDGKKKKKKQINW